jgi:hypothetical protein
MLSKASAAAGAFVLSEFGRNQERAAEGELSAEMKKVRI